MTASENKNNILAIWEIKTWIRAHLDEMPPMEELAARAKLSTRTFYRVFSEMAGLSPGEHIQRLRLARGAAWLAYSNASVIEAALAAGYDSREAFSRLFKMHYHCTPKEYRKRIQARIRALAEAPVPDGLRMVGIQDLPDMTLDACPHFGSPLSTLGAWRSLGAWAKSHKMITPSMQAVTVLYDDPVTLPPDTRERNDAALPVPPADVPTHDGKFICYPLRGGAYSVAEYTGAFSGLDHAWDYFGLVWFMQSGLQMRDYRCLMFNPPEEIPTGALQVARIIGGRTLHCRLCIPADTVAGESMPVLGMGG